MDRTRARFAAVGLLLLMASAAGCGSGSAPVTASAPRTSARPATTTRPAPSCRASASGVYTAAGRTYLLRVPADLRPTTRLLLDLHGYRQSATAQERYTGFAAFAAARGYVVVTPNGQRGQWNFPRSPALADDVGVVRAVVADARQRLCGAPSGRVGAVGWSDGADMAATLGCAGVVDAVAGVAASVFPSVPCPEPPPVVEIHGTADPFVPVTGGGGSRGGAFASTEAQPADARLGRWATTAGCSRPPQQARVAADVTRTTWGACAVLYRVDGGGHTWPGHTGAEPVPGLGATTTSIDANQLFVEFLQQHL